MSDNLICEINGLAIRKNTTYQIVDKIDNNALDGLRHYGSTKFPLSGSSDFVGPVYDKVAKVYDTGFYVHSPIYSGVSLEDRQSFVDKLHTNIVEPYELIYGIGVLDNKNTSFWDDFVINLESGRVFNTSNIQDLLELYIAMTGFHLTPSEKVGDPRFEKSSFVIEDRTSTLEKRNVRKANYMTALQKFFVMLSTNKHKLVPVLRYVGMKGAMFLDSDNTDDETINAYFKDWIDEEPAHVDDFLRVCKLAEKKLGMEEITMYSILLQKQKEKELVKVGDEYVYDEMPLGHDLKLSAKNLVTKTSLKTLREKLVSEEFDKLK